MAMSKIWGVIHINQIMLLFNGINLNYQKYDLEVSNQVRCSRDIRNLEITKYMQ